MNSISAKSAPVRSETRFIGRNSPFAFFLRLALFNLFLVSVLGVLMRYKIFASLPWMNMKHFLHGHSHFAFAGWVSLALMAGIFDRLCLGEKAFPEKSARWMLWAQVISAYGMLIAFPMQGYGAVAIFFSTASIVVSWIFAGAIWSFIKTESLGKPAVMALRSALIFNVLSALGTFYLVSLMIGKSHNQELYFGSVYFFLHFQYNGWFLFGILALFFMEFPEFSNRKIDRGILIQSLAAVPAVFLSMLWMKLPVWMYAFAVFASVAQLFGLYFFFDGLKDDAKRTGFSPTGFQKPLFICAGSALVLRSVLQALSVIPALGKFAFAYRPVVIGFLHLMLIGCITFFLLGFLERKGILSLKNSFHKTGVLLFSGGFFFTELVLMGQGLLYIGWVSIPNTNLFLLIFAVVMMVGIGLMNFKTVEEMS